MEYKYIKPLKEQEIIRKFFDKNHAVLPEYFEKYFEKYNGSRPSLNLFILENGEEKVLNTFLSFNEEDKENVFKAKRRVTEDNNEIIPFANDPAGNYFCLKKEKVVFYSHESGEIYPAADSFENFINKLQ